MKKLEVGLSPIHDSVAVAKFFARIFGESTKLSWCVFLPHFTLLVLFLPTFPPRFLLFFPFLFPPRFPFLFFSLSFKSYIKNPIPGLPSLVTSTIYGNEAINTKNDVTDGVKSLKNGTVLKPSNSAVISSMAPAGIIGPLDKFVKPPSFRVSRNGTNVVFVVA